MHFFIAYILVSLTLNVSLSALWLCVGFPFPLAPFLDFLFVLFGFSPLPFSFILFFVVFFLLFLTPPPHLPPPLCFFSVSSSFCWMDHVSTPCKTRSVVRRPEGAGPPYPVRERHCDWLVGGFKVCCEKEEVCVSLWLLDRTGSAAHRCSVSR